MKNILLVLFLSTFGQEKNLKENLMISCTIRFRNRYTDSLHDWVSELKSFDQLQAWISIEWKMLYDRY